MKKKCNKADVTIIQLLDERTNLKKQVDILSSTHSSSFFLFSDFLLLLFTVVVFFNYCKPLFGVPDYVALVVVRNEAPCNGTHFWRNRMQVSFKDTTQQEHCDLV